jgi:putative tricarboxylic transport membrane protein
MGRMFRRLDVLGGVLLVAFGVAGLVFGGPLDMGTTRRMGPGFSPKTLSWLLIGLGSSIAAGGLMRAGETATRITWRPVILITTRCRSSAP